MPNGYLTGVSPYTKVRNRHIKGAIVSGTDKVKNTVQDVGGKTKQAVGKVTGNTSKEAEGRADQAKSDMKNAGEKVKDAFKH